MQNMCKSTVYAIGKASDQQLAISSYVLEESKVICGFFTAQGRCVCVCVGGGCL